MTEREKYSEQEVYEMRRRLARKWNQSVSQMMDHEAIWYLHQEQIAERALQSTLTRA